MGSVTHLLGLAVEAGLSLSVAEGGRLVVKGPKVHETLARKLLARKPEVIAHLKGHPRPMPPPWKELSRLRWGPSVNDPSPGLDVGTPADHPRVLAEPLPEPRPFPAPSRDSEGFDP